MSSVWEKSDLGGTELLCLLAISDFANDRGIAFPSVATLAKKIRMSERNTHYLLKKLVEKGELEIEVNAGPGGCNLFRVQTLQGGCKPCTGGATHCTGGVQPIAPEPSLEPSYKYSYAFSEFWKAYPKKMSKGQAEKAWAKIKPSEQLTAQILDAVERAKTSVDWTKDGGKWIPYPASWLNAKGWLNEVAERKVSFV
jgi:hypothetical protein